MAAKWRVPGLRYFVVTSRADTRPFFLALGQNGILYVKQVSNIHWEDRVFIPYLNKIDWNKSSYRKNSTEKVSVPGKGSWISAQGHRASWMAFDPTTGLPNPLLPGKSCRGHRSASTFGAS
jgi:hypothetical protein